MATKRPTRTRAKGSRQAQKVAQWLEAGRRWLDAIGVAHEEGAVRLSALGWWPPNTEATKGAYLHGPQQWASPAAELRALTDSLRAEAKGECDVAPLLAIVDELQAKPGEFPTAEAVQAYVAARSVVVAMADACGLSLSAPHWNEPLDAGPRAVLDALKGAAGELKAGRIALLLPPFLLADVVRPADKSGQVRRWLGELMRRNPPLVQKAKRSGYYHATEHGKRWTGKAPESGR